MDISTPDKEGLGASEMDDSILTVDFFPCVEEGQADNESGKKGGKKKKGSKSGNPMKREAEEKALRQRLAGGGKSSGGSAFAKKPQNPALPAGLQEMMGENGMPDLPPNLGNGLGDLLG